MKKRIRGGGPGPAESDMEVTEITGAALDAARTLFAAFRTLAAALPQDATAGHPLDWRGRWYEQTEELATRLEPLARLIVPAVLGKPDAPTPDALEAETEWTATVRERLAAEVSGEPPRDFEPEDEVGELLREVGLAWLDHSAILARKGGEDGDLVLLLRPVPEATAHVWLLGRLYERIEAAVIDHPLLSLERRASAWWFDRWTMTEQATRRTGGGFASSVREQEWSLAERVTLTFGASVNVAFCDQPFFEEFPERIQELARALRASFANVFVIRQRHGDRLVLEGLGDGRRYEVHEHNPSVDYGPGQLMLGRLIPFKPRLYLRSPGMVGMDPRDPDELNAIREGLETAREQFSPAIAVEAMVTVIAGRSKPPRNVRPAASRGEAHELLLLLREELDRAGLGEAQPESEMPEDMRRGDDAHEYRSYELDRVVAEWMQTLMKYARRSR